VTKTREQILATKSILDIRGVEAPKYYVEKDDLSLAAEPVVAMANRGQLEKMVAESEKKMKAAAKDLDFISAAQYRDEMNALKKQLGERYGWHEG
jgi:excinuclease ABC subunit B